nr:hypothetical protein [Tanacetum cinerariifolium]
MENIDAYRYKDMGAIFGRPFYRDACVEARRFDGFTTIPNGNENDTYRMACSHPSLVSSPEIIITTLYFLGLLSKLILTLETIGRFLLSNDIPSDYKGGKWGVVNKLRSCDCLVSWGCREWVMG